MAAKLLSKSIKRQKRKNYLRAGSLTFESSCQHSFITLARPDNTWANKKHELFFTKSTITDQLDVLTSSPFLHYFLSFLPCPLPISGVSGVYKSQHTQPEKQFCINFQLNCFFLQKSKSHNILASLYLVHVLEAGIWEDHVVEWQRKILRRNRCHHFHCHRHHNHHRNQHHHHQQGKATDLNTIMCHASPHGLPHHHGKAVNIHSTEGLKACHVHPEIRHIIFHFPFIQKFCAHVMSRISGAMYLLVPTLGFCGMFVSPVAWVELIENTCQNISKLAKCFILNP